MRVRFPLRDKSLHGLQIFGPGLGIVDYVVPDTYDTGNPSVGSGLYCMRLLGVMIWCYEVIHANPTVLNLTLRLRYKQKNALQLL